MTTTYLVQYGRPGFVGRFRSGLGELMRGDRVVIRGPRGSEIGAVLAPLADRFTHTAVDGNLLRAATAEDDANAELLEARGLELLAAADSADLPLAFVDVETTLDGAAILHALPWGECDASPWLAELSRRFNLAVRLLDLSRTPTPTEEPEPAGCGKPGCGSSAGGCSSCGTGGGCSTGSCSSGKVKSAEELTAYFADLRGKMEAATAVRTPLV